MRSSSRALLLPGLALLAVAGCASSKVTDREVRVTEQIPRPERIWVHDFAATPEEIPDYSGFSGRHAAHSTPQTDDQIATGRRIGVEVATRLVEKIRAMGLPAERASAETRPAIDDLVIRGYLLSVQEGSAAKRVAIGLGSGTSDLKVAVEGYQVTDRGMRRLGSGTVEAGGSKTPGAVLPAAVFLATANPVGLIVVGGTKLYGEASGKSGIEGRAKAVADAIAKEIEPRFRQEGWIE